MSDILNGEGGYDLLGRTKDQIRTTEQVNAALAACQDLKLDGLVIIGGKIVACVYLENLSLIKWKKLQPNYDFPNYDFLLQVSLLIQMQLS